VSGTALLVACVGFGGLVGMGSGLLGVGGGIFMVPFLLHVAQLDQAAAAGTSLAVVLPTAIAGTVALQRRGVGDLRFGLRLGALGAAGGFVGAKLALELDDEVVQAVFAVLLAFTGVRLIRDGVRLRRGASATASRAGG
jgi:hypothetical protein